jgi:hypothetical protein
MGLAALLLACSLHPDDALLEAIISAYSDGNAYAVINVDFSVLDSQDEPLSMMDAPRSREAARAEMARIVAAGGEPVLGLLPVRPAWGEEFGKSTDELFQPCPNIAVASAKLSEFDYQCRAHAPRQTGAARRACTLERYGSSLGLAGLRSVIIPRLTRGTATSAAMRTSPDASVLLPRSDAGIFFSAAQPARPFPRHSDAPSPVDLLCADCELTTATGRR